MFVNVSFAEIKTFTTYQFWVVAYLSHQVVKLNPEGVSEENGFIFNSIPVFFSLMKQRLVFLHLLDHTTTNSRKTWVEVFPSTGIRPHKSQRMSKKKQKANSSFSSQH